VVGGEPVEQPGQERPFIRVQAPPPREGADPIQIVDGFIEAMASYTPAYATARMFLTEQAAQSWNPSASVTIYLGAKPVIQRIGDDTIDVTMTVTGTVGKDGTYTVAPDDAAKVLHLHVHQENGQWRIANPPAGIVIAEFSFSREYEAHNLYFFDADFDVLVPDPIYVPRYENAATLLAQRLLKGPSRWLAPAVRTGFPEGTELGVNAVPVESGVATVELSDKAALASPQDRERMTAQMVWTLAELPGVRQVALTSNGIPLPQGRQPMAISDANMAKYDADTLPAGTPLYAVANSGVVTINHSEVSPLVGPLGAVRGLREVAIDASGDYAAAITESGTGLTVAEITADGYIQTVLHGTSLSSPTWDRAGLVWVVDHGRKVSRLVATDVHGHALDVAIPQFSDADINRLAMSRDGVRIALVVGGHAYVGDVVRTSDPHPAIAVEQLRRIGPEGVALDVAWQASDSVVLLVRKPNQDPVPYVVGLSGQVITPRGPAVSGAVRVAAAPDQRVVVETSAGVLFEERSGDQWGKIATGRSPSYPG
jgi:hypothetical protein